MPSPFELVANPVSLVIFALYAALMGWEVLAPGRPLPPARRWPLKGLLYFVGYFALSNYLPLLWDRYLAEYQLFDLTGLGDGWGTLVGLSTYELCAWSYHRLLHATPWLWRLHQTHHSAERLDSFGAFVFHPLDMVGWTFTTSFALVVLVGLSPGATVNVILIVTWLGMFQHANIKTPRWLGYFVQRPEAHTVHHARGIHHKNFADLPLVDVLFGTFENPETFAHDVGLYAGSSKRNLDLWLLREITEPNPLPHESANKRSGPQRPGAYAPSLETN